jgi:nucleoside-diphosphate-sugar epimerase
MKVFIAGATGAVGRPLVRQLLDEGHEVTGLARNNDSARRLKDQGAEAEIVDLFDSKAVQAAMARSAPEVVINQLTALPKNYTPDSMQAATPVDRALRRDGGANLQSAAAASGVRRYILQSSAFWYEPGTGLADESSTFAIHASPYIASGSRFYYDLEQAARAIRGPELVLLRYGFLYGPGTWFANDGNVADQVRQGQFPVVGDGSAVWSWVHVEDAARAAVLVLDRGPAGAYNIVDDDPSPLKTWLGAYARWLGTSPPPSLTVGQVQDADLIYNATRLRGASNAKARNELDFRPRRLEWLRDSAAKERGSPEKSAAEKRVGKNVA